MKFSREGLVVIVLLIAASLFLRTLSHGEKIPLRETFANFPLQVESWFGTELALTPKVLKTLKVDDYLWREYTSTQGEFPVGLYIGYYKSMREGATYHSPKNCLPGSGWYFAKTGTTYLDVVDQSRHRVTINQFVIQKGLDKQLVLYWYQDRGRVIISEYWAKFYMIMDAITKNRTDGAFVRITVPFTGEGETKALQQGKAFAEKIFPLLREYLPG
jgi:EpsI family protein